MTFLDLKLPMLNFFNILSNRVLLISYFTIGRGFIADGVVVCSVLSVPAKHLGISDKPVLMIVYN